VSDAESFRSHIHEALKIAEQQTRAQGYTSEDFKYAVLAVVALLDESILNSQNPKFVDWPRKTLGHELFRTHEAGEVFFQNVQQLLGQADSPTLADILEVYDLCLLLGFGGRYSFGEKGELRAIRDAIAAKIRRIREYHPPLAPDWAPPEQSSLRSQVDPWARRYAVLALACFLLMIVLFITYKWVLSASSSELNAMAGV
jgi:type VI secretion system protein ImpK